MSDILTKFQLQGKIAIVTGGCGNLGPYWALALLEAGAKVVVIDLPGIPKPALLTKLPGILNSKIRYYQADITEIGNIKKVHERIKKDLGKIQILVNNAGIDAPPIKNKDKESPVSQIVKYQKMWDVNVQGLVNCIEEFSVDMIYKKEGSIINIGSLYLERSPHHELYTHLGFDKPWAYGATKAAVGQVTRHYSTRLAKHNIRVNTLSPGGVFGNQDKKFIEKYSQRVPLTRMAQKETDLGGPLVFLASDASSYVTGINLQVNGGYTAW